MVLWVFGLAVNAVAAGNAYFTPSVTRRVIEQTTGKNAAGQATSSPLEDLTAREHEVLQLVAEGLTNKQIAQRLVISPATAKTHLARIMQKLGASTRTQAAVRPRLRRSELIGFTSLPAAA